VVLSFGPFVFGRMTYRELDAENLDPADAALHLQARRYSCQVRQAVPSSSSPTSLKSKQIERLLNYPASSTIISTALHAAPHSGRWQASRLMSPFV
jgi:hypothetical protein